MGGAVPGFRDNDPHRHPLRAPRRARAGRRWADSGRASESGSRRLSGYPRLAIGQRDGVAGRCTHKLNDRRAGGARHRRRSRRRGDRGLRTRHHAHRIRCRPTRRNARGGPGPRIGRGPVRTHLHGFHHLERRSGPAVGPVSRARRRRRSPALRLRRDQRGGIALRRSLGDSGIRRGVRPLPPTQLALPAVRRSLVPPDDPRHRSRARDRGGGVGRPARASPAPPIRWGGLRRLRRNGPSVRGGRESLRRRVRGLDPVGRRRGMDVGLSGWDLGQRGAGRGVRENPADRTVRGRDRPRHAARRTQLRALRLERRGRRQQGDLRLPQRGPGEREGVGQEGADWHHVAWEDFREARFRRAPEGSGS